MKCPKYEDYKKNEDSLMAQFQRQLSDLVKVQTQDQAERIPNHYTTSQHCLYLKEGVKHINQISLLPKVSNDKLEESIRITQIRMITTADMEMQPEVCKDGATQPIPKDVGDAAERNLQIEQELQGSSAQPQKLQDQSAKPQELKDQSEKTLKSQRQCQVISEEQFYLRVLRPLKKCPKGPKTKGISKTQKERNLGSN